MSHQAGVPGRPDRAVERWLRAEVVSAAGSDLRRAMVLGALAAALALPQAWLLAHAIAPVVMEKAPLAWALSWLLPALPLLALRFGLAAWSGRTALAAASRIKARVRSALLNDVSALAPDPRRTSGKVVAAVLEGVDALDAYLSRFLTHLGVLVILPPLILIVVLRRDWILALVLRATAPVIPLFMVLLGNGAARLNRRQWQRLARLSGRLLDGLQRLTTLRMLNADEREAERLAAEDYRRDHARMEALAQRSASLPCEARGPHRPATLGRSVTIDCVGVGLAWEPGRPTLKGVSLRLPPWSVGTRWRRQRGDCSTLPIERPPSSRCRGHRRHPATAAWSSRTCVCAMSPMRPRRSTASTLRSTAVDTSLFWGRVAPARVRSAAY